MSAETQLYPTAQPCRKDFSEIYQIAEEFAADRGYRPGGEIIPFIEQKLGGVVEFQDYDDWRGSQDGSIVVHGPDSDPLFEVYVSRFTGALRNRFTLAHEIGHFVLHSDLGQKQIRAARSGRTLEEAEANHFAAAFLMPRAEFKKALEDYDQDLLMVASRFRVSRAAANVRKELLRAQP